MGVSGSLGLNARAAALTEAVGQEGAALGVRTSTLGNGARVLDFGTDAPGGLEAGRLLAQICMGGIGQVQLAPWFLDDLSFPGVAVWTDLPAIACLASQYAGWAVKPEGYFAMGSG
ncbi:MAG TPA: methenyltetrahydromethanopterin cyclohydrolase, partial [Longimicrobiales bacterium]